jgi:hypothetical protein
VKPIVRAAIAMLDQFGATDPEAASAVLSWWPRYNELTEDDLQEVVALYELPSYAECGKDEHRSEDHPLIRGRHLGELMEPDP